MKFSSIQALIDWCTEHPTCGIADTALLMKWSDLIKSFPTSKFVLIERDLSEVIQSVQELGVSGKNCVKLYTKLQQAKKDPRVWTIPFERLNEEAFCQALYEYCTELPFDKDRWESLRRINMQPVLPLFFQDISKNEENLVKLYGDNHADIE
ncbi:MAG: hypothetical protein KGL39_10030 [Patescibacteria group bacterium]|nr:hypothetical protein [Patescibacteria group bacterium]